MEMVQNGIMQNHYARPLQRALMDLSMQLVIPQVIQKNAGIGRIHFHPAQLLERAQERRGIIGHAGSRRRKRREETGLHSFLRGPNSAVPTRTMVAPSWMATSRSCDIPIERCRKPCCSARSRSRTK